MDKIEELLPKNATVKQRDDILRFFGWKPRAWQVAELHRMRRAVTKHDGVYGLVMARQNGKSYNDNWFAIEKSALEGYSGAITVHNDKLKKKLLRELIKDVSKLQEAGLVARVLRGDDASIEFTNGAIIYIVIRTEGFITGLTLDYLIHDEAQKMDDALEDEAEAVLSQSHLGYMAYIGTPQTKRDHEKYGLNRFTRMLESSHEAMSLYCAYPDYNEDLEFNWAVLAKANPSWRETPNYKKKMQRRWATQSRESFWNFWGAVPQRRSDGPARKPARFTPAEVEGFLTRKGSVGSHFILSIGITAESDIAYGAVNDGIRTEIGGRWEVPLGELHQIAEEVKAQARSFSQIRISGTSRGKTLADMLKERGLTAKLKLMGMPETSSNLNLMVSQLVEGKLKVWDNDPKAETKTALSSFWMELHTRSGGAVPVSSLKTEEALIVALANSALDDKTADRIRNRNRYAVGQENSSPGQQAPTPRRYAW